MNACLPAHPQVLLLVTFNLIAGAWLPQLPLGGGAAGGKKKGSGRGGGSGHPLLRWSERVYLWGLVAVELGTSWVLPPLLGERLPFLPVAAVSLYCSAGLVYSWARLAALTWR